MVSISNSTTPTSNSFNAFGVDPSYMNILLEQQPAGRLAEVVLDVTDVTTTRIMNFCFTTYYATTILPFRRPDGLAIHKHLIADFEKLAATAITIFSFKRKFSH
jgi:hypothetical protein